VKGGLGDPRARAQPRVEVAQLVAFGVGTGEYAVDIMRIKEIINPVPVVPMPKAPAFIEGVIELRGAILPVIDVRKRFDLPPSTPTRATKFLIVGLDIGRAGAEEPLTRMIVGLVVDRVSEPLRVPKADIKPAPQLTVAEQAFFNGVVHHQGRMLMVLEVDALLSSHEKLTLAGLAG
jgi:purine-binding chemotaxis protein CheW